MFVLILLHWVLQNTVNYQRKTSCIMYGQLQEMLQELNGLVKTGVQQ